MVRKIAAVSGLANKVRSPLFEQQADNADRHCCENEQPCHLLIGSQPDGLGSK